MTIRMIDGWLYWALLSAIFAALTAIFTKIGLKDVDPDYATLIPTFVIAIVIAAYIYFTDKWSNPFAERPEHSHSSLCLDWPQLHHGYVIFGH